MAFNGKMLAVLVLHKFHDVILGQTKTEQLSLQVRQILRGKYFHV